MFLIFYTSHLSGVSSSLMIAIYSSTVLTTAIAFYFLYGEKPSFKHLVGMILVVISIVMIAYSKQSFELSLTGNSEASVGLTESGKQ